MIELSLRVVELSTIMGDCLPKLAPSDAGIKSLIATQNELLTSFVHHTKKLKSLEVGLEKKIQELNGESESESEGENSSATCASSKMSNRSIKEAGRKWARIYEELEVIKDFQGIPRVPRGSPRDPQGLP